MKHLKLYERFEDDDDHIETDVMDILQDISDDYDVDIEYHESSEFWINSLDKDVIAIRIVLSFGPGGLTFRCIKSNVDHLISYMKSIGYSNFIYKDDELNFNQYNARIQNTTGRITQEQNYLPTDDNIIEYGIFTFIKD